MHVNNLSLSLSVVMENMMWYEAGNNCLTWSRRTCVKQEDLRPHIQINHSHLYMTKAGVNRLNTFRDVLQVQMKCTADVAGLPGSSVKSVSAPWEEWKTQRRQQVEVHHRNDMAEVTVSNAGCSGRCFLWHAGVETMQEVARRGSFISPIHLDVKIILSVKVLGCPGHSSRKCWRCGQLDFLSLEPLTLLTHYQDADKNPVFSTLKRFVCFVFFWGGGQILHLRQGCPLSPSLFATFTESLDAAIRQNPWVKRDSNTEYRPQKSACTLMIYDCFYKTHLPHHHHKKLFILHFLWILKRNKSSTLSLHTHKLPLCTNHKLSITPLLNTRGDGLQHNRTILPKLILTYSQWFQHNPSTSPSCI